MAAEPESIAVEPAPLATAPLPQASESGWVAEGGVAPSPSCSQTSPEIAGADAIAPATRTAWSRRAHMHWPFAFASPEDRKSEGQGTGVSLREDAGGRRYLELKQSYMCWVGLKDHSYHYNAHLRIY